MAFIIDRYDKFDAWDRKHARYKFEINGQMYAIMEVILFWGEPQFEVRVDREKDPETYRIYETMEEAMEFVHCIRQLN